MNHKKINYLLLAVLAVFAFFGFVFPVMDVSILHAFLPEWVFEYSISSFVFTRLVFFLVLFYLVLLFHFKRVQVPGLIGKAAFLIMLLVNPVFPYFPLYSIVMESVAMIFLIFLFIMFYLEKEEEEWKLLKWLKEKTTRQIGLAFAVLILFLTILLLCSSKALIIQQRIELAGGLFM